MDGAVLKLLEETLYGHLSTLGRDGYPYTVPVHHVLWNGGIYIHGRRAGRKRENISGDDRVCYTAERLIGIRDKGAVTPCRVGAAFESAVIKGVASMVSGEEKRTALSLFAKKYAPALAGAAIPRETAEATEVYRISVVEATFRKKE